MNESISEISCDAVIIGCGPGGERAAIQAARAGKTVVVVERSHVVGGARVNWGTIPSKTLRESALFVDSLTRHRLHGISCYVSDHITVADFMHRERVVVQRELELINSTLDHHGITVERGHGRFVDAHHVEVLDGGGHRTALLEAGVIVIATGTSPNRPPDVPFDSESVFDSDTILAMPRMPQSLIVLGAGVIAVEYASIFSCLGLEVTLVDTRDQLLPYLDREIATLLERGMEEGGVRFVHADRYERIEVRPGKGVFCRTRGGLDLEASALLYCVGRDGNSRDIGLDRIGLTATSYGLIPVNENCQTSHPHIYAVGDVIGFPALASTSMEQGVRAIRHAFSLDVTCAESRNLPYAIYSTPEVSSVGQTEEQVQKLGMPYVVGRGLYEINARGQIIGDTRGILKMLCEAGDGKLLGIHVVGQAASELIHTGQAYLRMGATCYEIAGALFNYPTLSDLYRHAALEAIAAIRRRGEGG